jgi:hypothetical protein
MSQTRLRRREPSQSIRDAEYQDHITLARAVEAIVDRRVLELLGSRADDDYSSDRLPPEIETRKHFARVLSSGLIAGATQDGRRGIWRCSREAWHRARDRRPAPRLALVPDQLSDEALATAAIARGGRR